MLKVILQYLLAGNVKSFLFIFLFIIGTYLVWSIGGKILVNYLYNRDKKISVTIKKQCKATAIAIVLLISLSTITALLLLVVMRPGIDKQIIATNNNSLMEIDHSIFNVYPPIWLQQSDNEYKSMIDAVTPLLMNIYYGFALMLSISLFILFFFGTRLCISFICAFFVCSTISMPFWYFFPATSPMIAYWDPGIFQDIPSAIRDALKMYSPLPLLEIDLQENVDFRNLAKDTTLFVTTIPSMHIAWSFLITHYLITLSRIFAIVVIPFFILNSVSTVITMQHYAIDTLGGTLIAMVAIYVTKVLADRYIHIFDPMVSLVQHDVRSAREWLRSLVK